MFTRYSRSIRYRAIAATLATTRAATLAATGAAALAGILFSPFTAHAASSALESLAGSLELRAIGPAMMGGRIADIAVDPTKPSTWYIGVGSGGVWKTENAGISWIPVFDDQRSYSIGEVTLDPSNPSTVWVGTGENVSGRHVGWGDGVYRSLDGGATWAAMGLEKSEHIGRILVDPNDSMHILVAAEGPLWSAGGERGVYRSTDGGETWTQVLGVDANTGATDLEFHPSDPSVVYAATYERRRTVWTFLAGGHGSGFYKSTDGGATWREVTRGLPTADAQLEVGKIGIAVTPADPDRVYATIEANDGKQGFFVSLDRGESWTKRNDYISGGTGPHYYQEIEASPLNADHVYQMDVFLHASKDGGNTFDYLETGRDKHSDNHALWLDPSRSGHLLGGTDGGLYESFDDGKTWRHFPNLPISQLYKVAVSNHTPYYNVLVGAQDLGTLHGPARTTTEEGIRNQDWLVPYGADGYGVAFDPTDADVYYQMSQKGNLVRYHVPSGENMNIRPQPAPGEGPERWNWDSPLEVSVHQPGRIYFASQRVWQSDDRGDSWTPISADLTRASDRYMLPVNGRVRSADALWDTGAMSGYASLTAVSESALSPGVIWTGSDDGLVHYTADGGKRWQALSVDGLPERAFVNDIEASQHNPRGAFLVADNHKTGDYRPLLFATDNGGKRWREISGDLPSDVLVWSIQQDAKEPGLLFLGAEDGLYVTLNGGAHWEKLKGNVPTVPFRDVKLQRRDNDLVAASFGRGVYVLDDYTPLRSLAALEREQSAQAPALFPVRDAWWYIPSRPGQAKGLPSQGTDAWRAPNPQIGPMFTLYLSEVEKGAREARRESEQALDESGKDVPFPGWEALAKEATAPEPRYFLEISTLSGDPVRRLRVPAQVGAQRIHWDMRGPASAPIKFPDGGFQAPWMSDPEGPLVAPGDYRAQLLRVDAGGVEMLGQPQGFTLRTLETLPAGVDALAVATFHGEVSAAKGRSSAVAAALAELRDELRYLREAAVVAPAADHAVQMALDAMAVRIDELQTRYRGNSARRRLNEPTVHGASSRLSNAARALGTRMTPTATQREDLKIGLAALSEIETGIKALRDGDLAALRDALREANAPYVPGRQVGTAN